MTRWRMVALAGGAVAVLALLVVLVPARRAVLPPAFDGARAFAFLEEQCALGPRVPGTEAHGQCKRLLVERLSGWSPSVEAEEVEGIDALDRELAGWNIRATFPGRDPVLLLGAHWDCRAWADQDPDPACRELPVPGANDGASGVAVLLEMARLMSISPPPRRVVVVLFDLEDQGAHGDPNRFCWGSRRAAREMPPSAGAEAIVVDMVGSRDLVLHQEAFSRRLAGDFTREIWGIARSAGISCFSAEPGVALMDDHVPFLRAGWRAVDLVDLRYPYWHTTADTPDKCSPASLAAVGEVLRRYLYRLPSAGS